MHYQKRALALKRLEDYQVRQRLEALEKDPALETEATSYTAKTDLYPSGQIPFVEKHLAYLMDHPNLDPDHYLSNLKLMLKRL